MDTPGPDGTVTDTYDNSSNGELALSTARCPLTLTTHDHLS